MNNVVLFGTMTKEPELRYTQGGTAVTHLSLAVPKKLSKEKKQELEQQGKYTADFINCTAFGATAEAIANYVRKGHQVCLRGRMQTDIYEKDGQTQYRTYVSVEEADFVRKPKDEENSTPPLANNQSRQNNQQEDFYQINNADIPF